MGNNLAGESVSHCSSRFDDSIDSLKGCRNLHSMHAASSISVGRLVLTFVTDIVTSIHYLNEASGDRKFPVAISLYLLRAFMQVSFRSLLYNSRFLE